MRPLPTGRAHHQHGRRRFGAAVPLASLLAATIVLIILLMRSPPQLNDSDGGSWQLGGAASRRDAGSTFGTATTVQGSAPTLPWHSREQSGRQAGPAPPLALLVPLMTSAGQAEVLLEYMRAHLRKEGRPFHIHLVEQQPGSQPFNPGMLVNLGFQAAQQQFQQQRRRWHPGAAAAAAAAAAAMDIAYQQPTLLPHPNVSYMRPRGTTFQHLAAEQAQYLYRLPYPLYCGGAWLMTAQLFHHIGGFSASYVGFDGAEDDLCRRVLHLQHQQQQAGDDREGDSSSRDGSSGSGGAGGSILRPSAGAGRFWAAQDPELQELAARHRQRNRHTFHQRWGEAAGGQASSSEHRQAAELAAALDGLAVLPADWQQWLTLKQQGDAYSWWLANLDSLPLLLQHSGML